MCGIAAYVGHRPALPIVIRGLQRLEYRGYDSVGVGFVEDDVFQTIKRKGKVSELNFLLEKNKSDVRIAIGHTRWATHGVPSDVNAHPHRSNSGRISLVHNGIIENNHILKAELLEKGYIFESETDTEVLANFIEDVSKNYTGDFLAALQVVFEHVVGAYGLVIMHIDFPDQLIVVRKGSPLVIGLGDGEAFVASDATPFLEYTNEVVYLQDDEIAVVKGDGIQVIEEGNIERTPYVHTLDMKLEAIEKGGFPHFMLKEIFEQPQSIEDCMRGRIDHSTNRVKLGGINKYTQEFYQAEKIIITACGTSFYAGKVAEYIFEELARIPVEVEYASEFRYRNPVLGTKDVILGISQSGETADTKVALEMAAKNGNRIFGVCNVVGSTIARITDEGVYTHAGPEIGVASTKAFTAQLTVLSLMAIKMGRERGVLDKKRAERLISSLQAIPDKIIQILKLNDSIRELSERFQYASNFLYLGRGYNYPVALEGALKLKEISYIHAEGYPAAEMKHGPIALIDRDMPVVFIAIKDSAYGKVLSNIQEVKSRDGKVIAIITQGDEVVKGMVDYYIEIPEVEEILSPLLTVIPLQLLAYHISVLKGRNVDQPRNLAKSVTVE